MPVTMNPRRMTLHEEAYAPPSRIDEANRVIRGVKICGFKSRNGRTYPRELLKKSAGLYEDRPVYIGTGKSGALEHARREGRQFGRRVGVLRGVHLAEDGLRGDIHYDQAHPDAGRLVWYARNASRGVGLSHDAEGTCEGGTVTGLERVLAVELVDFPATNRGLFESDDPSAFAPDQAQVATGMIPKAVENGVSEFLNLVTSQMALPNRGLAVDALNAPNELMDLLERFCRVLPDHPKKTALVVETARSAAELRRFMDAAVKDASAMVPIHPGKIELHGKAIRKATRTLIDQMHKGPPGLEVGRCGEGGTHGGELAPPRCPRASQAGRRGRSGRFGNRDVRRPGQSRVGTSCRPRPRQA